MSEAVPSIFSLLVFSFGLGLMAFALVAVTSFVKITIVLFLVRNALGAQHVPPNIVLYVVAIILSAYLAAPLASQITSITNAPAARYQTFQDWSNVADKVRVPVKAHLSPDLERDPYVDVAETCVSYAIGILHDGTPDEVCIADNPRLRCDSRTVCAQRYRKVKAAADDGDAMPALDGWIVRDGHRANAQHVQGPGGQHQRSPPDRGVDREIKSGAIERCLFQTRDSQIPDRGRHIQSNIERIIVEPGIKADDMPAGA